MSHFMPPALLALFAPRPPTTWKPPIPRKKPPKLTGIAQYVKHMVPDSELPPLVVTETPQLRKKRLKKEKEEAHKKLLAERTKKWDPHSNLDKKTKEPYKTLFVARLDYKVTEDDLREEFGRYGPLKDIKLIRDNKTNESRGYAFIEFESSRHFKDAFKYANGKKLKSRRILVDVERGRTVPSWKPRKLGGGLGKTRQGKIEKDKKKDKESSSNHRDNHRNSRRDRDNRNRDRDHNNNRDYRRDNHRDRDRRDNHRDYYNNNRRDHRDRDRNRDRDRDRDRDRNRDRNNRRYDNNRRRSRSRDRNNNFNDISSNTRGDRDRYYERERDINISNNRDRSRERRRNNHSRRYDRRR